MMGVNRKARGFRNLTVEGLESRTVLAGNVVAEISGGDLYVTGDNANNSVVVLRVNATQVAVVGQAATTINGGALALLTLPSNPDLWIDMNGGNDAVIVGSGNANAPLFIADDLIYRGDDGNDSLTLLNTRVGSVAEFWGGSGNDNLTLTGNTDIDLSLLVRGEGGNDVVLLNGASPANPVTVGGDLNAFTGAGNDVVFAQFAAIGDDAIIHTEDDNDIVVLRSSSVNDVLDVNTGSGNDIVALLATVAQPNRARIANINGGSGTNSLIINQNNATAQQFGDLNTNNF